MQPVCASSEVADGAMRAVDLGGRAVLLARVGGVCHAIDGICPHAGGKLAEGVLHGGVVICPWHKAAFDVTTGRRVEPPAVDDLLRYTVREADGTISVQAAPAATTVSQPDPRCMAIVGAGAAGAAAAQALREDGFGGRVVLISREALLPYDRTVLSKYTLSGKQGGEKSPLQDAAYYQEHRIERMGAEVTGIDPARRRIAFGDGTSLAYDAALLATGGTARQLDVKGAELPGVFTLRTPGDAALIVAAAAKARNVVVAGGGFIAMEAAASLRERGLSVTVVVPQQAPFERVLGHEVGRAIQRVHEGTGIVFRLGTAVKSIEGGDRVRAVHLQDGTVLDAQLVVVGLGVSLATGMLDGVTRRKDGGLDVDSTLRVADGLYAAGDVAAFPLRGEGERVRVEHWRVAQQHGRVAAANMLGGSRRYTAVPYFWTIHFKKRLDYVGHAASWDEVVIDGDLTKPDFLACYVSAGRVAAVAGWGRDMQMATALALMEDRQDWTVDALQRALP